MKSQKLIVIAAIVCLLAVFVSGPAYAQEDLPEIIIEFCEEILNDAEKANRDLDKANEDGGKCRGDFVDCRTGEGFGTSNSLVECLDESTTCTNRAIEDKLKACSEFSEDLEDAYEDAARRADRKDVEEEFEEWLETPSAARRYCLLPSIQVFRRCTGQIARNGGN